MKRKKVKGGKVTREDAAVASDRRATVPMLADVGGGGADGFEGAPSTVAGTAAATTDGEQPISLRSAGPTTTEEISDGHRPPLQGKGSRKSAVMRERWRRIRAGELPNPYSVKPASRGPENPLLGLPDEQRGTLFAWLRECPYDDAVQNMLREQGLGEVSREQLGEFFQAEAELHWEHRLGRAAQEADALVQLVERSPVKFSASILAALGQEVFRQVASGQVEPSAMAKLANLFMKARSDERADQMQELRRQKLRSELKQGYERALEELAAQVEKHPAARAAFEALQRELAGKTD